MKLKNVLLLVIYLTTLTCLVSCGSDSNSVDEAVVVDDSVSDSASDNTDDTQEDSTDDTVDDSVDATVDDSNDDSTVDSVQGDSEDGVWDTNEEILVELEVNSISVTGSGAIVDDTNLLISAAGTYRITGSLSDGQIIVDSDDDEIVRLIFDNMDITNSNNAPINIQSAARTIIVLAAGTYNTLTDANEYTYADGEDEPNAALYSKDDLTITGSGYLTVNANYNDGITSKDGLLISNGNISVVAKDDGIRGKDYLIIEDGNFTVNAQGDAFKSDNEDDGKGYISIASGIFNLTAGADGIQAKSSIEIVDGDFTLSSGGGSSANLGSDDSAKALKATLDITIESGDFTIDSADDAIHANGSITIDGGTFEIASGDDGIHADIEIKINDGDINIAKSYEGIESEVIIINGGNIHVIASDDGINVAGGADNSGYTPRGNSGNSDYYLQINDGYIVVNATGDGLDSNGNIEMSGGIVLVNGPTGNGNGALDYDGTYYISGGFLIAVGSSGMTQGPSSASSQHWLGLNLSSSQAAGNLIHIENSGGDTMVTFSPEKKYQSVVFSSADLQSSDSYKLYLGGSATGTQTDGLYEGGSYSGGTLTYTFSSN